MNLSLGYIHSNVKLYEGSFKTNLIRFLGDFDLSPFISEIIIEKMDINFVCSQKCKGLCSFCGINKNNLSCNHNEKNSKESPFSSLSQLDL